MRSAFDHAPAQWGADWSHLGAISARGNRSWSQMTAAFPDWQKDGRFEAKKLSRVTTKAGFKKMIGKALRYAAFTGSTPDSLAYANKLLQLGSSEDSQAYFNSAVSLFKRGIPEKKIEPAIYSVAFLQGMQTENKLDFAAIGKGSGSLAPTRQGLAHSALSETERQSYLDDDKGKMAVWWEENKKWAFPASMGVVALIGIGIFFRAKGNKQMSAAPTAPSRRRRAR